MIDVHTLTLFISASIATILAPGPDTIYVFTKSISGGIRPGLFSALGILSGVLIHITAAILGLSLVLRRSAVAYTVVKYVGAAYLVYLGIQEFRARGELQIQQGSNEMTTRECYLQGVMIDALNPKMAVFFLALLPQFVEPGSGATIEMTLLGLLFAALAVPWLTIIILSSSKLKTLISTHPTVIDIIRWVAGTVLIGFGVELALEERISS